MISAIISEKNFFQYVDMIILWEYYWSTKDDMIINEKEDYMIIRKIDKKKKVLISFKVNEETKKEYEQIESSLSEKGFALDADEVIRRVIKSIRKSETGTRQTAGVTGGER
jgi:hypothetical protein